MEERPVQPDERNELVRLYAAGEITWHTLQERGFEDYVQVLGAWLTRPAASDRADGGAELGRVRTRARASSSSFASKPVSGAFSLIVTDTFHLHRDRCRPSSQKRQQ